MKGENAMNKSIICILFLLCIMLTISGCSSQKLPIDSSKQSELISNNSSPKILNKEINIQYNSITDEDAIKKSVLIAEGTVLNINEKVYFENDFVFTYAEIKINNIIFGDSSYLNKIVKLKQLGGEYENIVYHYSNSVKYDLGEKILFFVSETNEDSMQIVNDNYKFVMNDDGSLIKGRTEVYNKEKAKELMRLIDNFKVSKVTSTSSRAPVSNGNTNTMTKITDTQAAKKSDIIISGEIISIGTTYENGDSIQSDVKIQVENVLKGKYTNTTITLPQFGGEYKGVSYSNKTGVVFPDTQSKVILFLEINGDDYNIVNNEYIFTLQGDSYIRLHSIKQYTFTEIKNLIQ